jgi:hypothetical protein
MPESIPQDDYDRAAACLVRCEDANCVSSGTATATETCDLNYRDCAEDCDRCAEIHSF